MRSAFYLLAFLALGSCDSLWGSYETDNERNCTKNSALCGPGYLCDSKGTQQCVKACTSYTDCSGANICHNGMCMSCGLLSPADVPTECGKRTPVNTLMACFQDTCVQCTDSSQCADDSACGADHVCTNACTKHEDCQSDVCDVYQMNSKGSAGKCLSTQAVTYVDNKNGACTGKHTGTKADPFCAISDALGKSLVRVLPSTSGYGSVNIGTGTMSLYGGFGSGPVTTLGGDAGTPGLAVSGNATVIVDGFVIDQSAGVTCSTASLSLRRTKVSRSAGVGMQADSCTPFKLDRVSLSGGSDSALSMTGDTGYTVTNSFLTNNTSGMSPTVKIANNASGSFQFNTVAGNLSTVAALDCGLVMRSIDDSIVFGNGNAALSQFSAACTLKNTVVGAKDVTKNGIMTDPDFVSPGAPSYDYHLKDGAGSASCCIDKGTTTPTVTVDFDGTHRPQRQGYDIGAHELQ